MMMSVANGGGTAVFPRSGGAKPIPPWTIAAITASIGVHLAGGVWLYHQRYAMPEPEARPKPPATVIEIWNRPRIQPDPTPAPEATRPPPPIHQPRAVPVEPAVTSPFTPPDGLSAPIEASAPLVSPAPEAVIGGTSTEPTPPVSPGVIRNPSWVRTPSAAQMERAWPSAAIRNGVEGRVVLDCLVTASGGVTACSVVSETPQRTGFGRAALSLSRYFVMSPRTVDGEAVEGARVTIPLLFSLGD